MNFALVFNKSIIDGLKIEREIERETERENWNETEWDRIRERMRNKRHYIMIKGRVVLKLSEICLGYQLAFDWWVGKRDSIGVVSFKGNCFSVKFQWS